MELKVAVQAGRGAVDPVKFLLGDGNIVEYGLYIARLRQHVIVYLVEERGDADMLRPLPRVPGCEPDACAQHKVTFS
ncbi:MAG TPA: hypothetical protein VL485_04320 [Ktedonobacteraceae bacterium]|nr:hypothetical protein [Ktedonobacteraceae bacterium]